MEGEHGIKSSLRLSSKEEERARGVGEMVERVESRGEGQEELERS